MYIYLFFFFFLLFFICLFACVFLLICFVCLFTFFSLSFILYHISVIMTYLHSSRQPMIKPQTTPNNIIIIGRNYLFHQHKEEHVIWSGWRCKLFDTKLIWSSSYLFLLRRSWNKLIFFTWQLGRELDETWDSGGIGLVRKGNSMIGRERMSVWDRQTYRWMNVSDYKCISMTQKS